MPSPGFEDLYNCLRTAGNPIVSHMADAFTKTAALYSCVEVKPASGDHTEAEFQLSVWMAASLRKKMQLARRVGLVDKSSLVEPTTGMKTVLELKLYLEVIIPTVL
ncbi:hypothetical protein PMIN01_13602 [Paraphaeosphaeria minitans]|uniref:PD-(D/E)XK nuclease-like domain-containing protein n=1 Tax=Paraphaeosphaeria minitans TaxID=565426 RepID=A0A9P6KJJ7_9PLEO|nr:hypothetical protein PMIN01_13602 [Paraphaeosphaeria minitans]